LQQAPGQVSLPVHCTTQQHVAVVHFVEEHVLVERAEDHQETPIAQPDMSEPGARSKERMLLKEPTGCRHSI
jgi:hypothetical protein